MNVFLCKRIILCKQFWVVTLQSIIDKSKSLSIEVLHSLYHSSNLLTSSECFLIICKRLFFSIVHRIQASNSNSYMIFLTLCFLITYTSHPLSHHASFHYSKPTLVKRIPTIEVANRPVLQFQHTPKMPVHRKSAISRATQLCSLANRSIYYDSLSMMMESIWIQGANRLLQGLQRVCIGLKDEKNRRRESYRHG